MLSRIFIDGNSSPSAMQKQSMNVLGSVLLGFLLQKHLPVSKFVYQSCGMLHVVFPKQQLLMQRWDVAGICDYHRWHQQKQITTVLVFSAESGIHFLAEMVKKWNARDSEVVEQGSISGSVWKIDLSFYNPRHCDITSYGLYHGLGVIEPQNEFSFSIRPQLSERVLLVINHRVRLQHIHAIALQLVGKTF